MTLILQHGASAKPYTCLLTLAQCDLREGRESGKGGGDGQREGGREGVGGRERGGWGIGCDVWNHYISSPSP